MISAVKSGLARFRHLAVTPVAFTARPWILPAVGTAFFGLGVVWALAGGEGEGRPRDPVFFVDIYFLRVFLLQAGLVAGWFVTIRKPRPARLAEYRMLQSLPVPSRRIGLHFLILELRDRFWLPSAFGVTYFGLAPLASLPYVMRPALFAFSLYLFLVAGIAALELLVLERRQAAGMSDYLSRNNPAISLAAAGLFLSGNVVFMLALSAGAAWSFVFTVGMLLTGTVLLAKWYVTAFSRLGRAGFWMRSVGNSGPIHRERRPVWLRLVNGTTPIHGWLVKQALQGSRVRAHLLESGLTLLFFGTGYLMAANNPNPGDVLDVLYWLFLVFVAVSGYLLLNRFSPEQEPTQLLHALPVTRVQFYLAMALPACFRLVTLASVLVAWLFVQGYELSALVAFWRDAVLAGGMLLILAANCGAGTYPGLARAKNRYSAWVLAAVLFCAVFYQFRWAVAILLTVISSLQLLQVRFYADHRSRSA